MTITITLAEAVEYEKLKSEVPSLKTNEVGYKQRITVLEEQVARLKGDRLETLKEGARVKDATIPEIFNGKEVDPANIKSWIVTK